MAMTGLRGSDGLPYEDVTCLAEGFEGDLWIGTTHGAIRKVGEGYKPRVVFTSSIAVFGAPFPDAIGDEFLNAPLTSYGTQKAIGELLLSD